MTIKFKWTTDVNPKYIEQYYDEDSNWFDTREQAIVWLKEQKQKDEDFGAEVCFLLIELFII